MAKVIDIADMKQRVATTEAKLSAAAQEGRKRNERLLDLLDAVEKNLAHKQRQISLLEEEQGRALEEVQQLRNLLHVRALCNNLLQHPKRLAS
jgi:predicted nuclease with TOPRIM domain